MATVPTTSWDENSPPGGQSIKLGDDRIRELKTQVREVIGVDHDFPSSGQATDNGQHLRVTLQEQADLGTGAVGTTILGNQTVSGKGELVYTNEDDADVQITSSTALAFSATANKTALVNLLFPVGFIYISTASTNPGTYLGGTWTACGAGRVLVGNGTSDAAYAAGATGGASTVTLTGAQSGIAAHAHSIPAQEGYAAGTGYLGGRSNTAAPAWNAATSNVSAANASESHPNMPPYLVVYFWERTA